MYDLVLHQWKKEIIIDGNHLQTLEEFYDEIENKLTKNLGWKTGRNLDAYNDILRGGFGVHEYKEPINIKWINAAKSKIYLGQTETIKYLGDLLKRCHPTNISRLKKDLEDIQNNKGKTLFDRIVEITQMHEHVELELID